MSNENKPQSWLNKVSSLSRNKKILVVLSICLIASLGSYVAATTYNYIYNQSNTDTGTGQEAASVDTQVTTTFALSAHSWTVGDPVTLTATLSPALNGVVVFFYEGTGLNDAGRVGVNQATTVNGVASITIAGPSGAHTYFAMPQK